MTDLAVPLPRADVAELVDALDLGSSAERRGGSSPLIRTTLWAGQSVTRSGNVTFSASPGACFGFDEAARHDIRAPSPLGPA